MNNGRRNILSFLDSTVRWTARHSRVTDHRKHQPLRWIPLWPIAFSILLFVLSFLWPSAILTSLGAVIVVMVGGIHANGPLGTSALQDDEREAALRKDSFLFCLGLLAFLNCVGQLLLMGLSHLQNWDIARSVFVAASAFLLNLTLFGCLPTLYASWHLGQLPKEG